MEGGGFGRGGAGRRPRQQAMKRGLRRSSAPIVVGGAAAAQ